jgi:hypothetical protein
MKTLPSQITDMDKGLAMLVAWPEHEVFLQLVAQLALHQPVRVVVGGNHFQAYTLARHIRRQTVHVDTVLGRIQVARPFTCYQLLSLITQLPATSDPLLILDLLQPLADENISALESYRLLYLLIDHLHRLRQTAPVIVTLQPPPQPDRTGLVTLLQKTADIILLPDSPTPPIPLRLL